jgi:hypothetical protein
MSYEWKIVSEQQQCFTLHFIEDNFNIANTEHRIFSLCVSNHADTCEDLFIVYVNKLNILNVLHNLQLTRFLLSFALSIFGWAQPSLCDRVKRENYTILQETLGHYWRAMNATT